MLKVLATLLAAVALSFTLNAQYGHRRGVDTVPAPVPRQNVIVTFKGVLKQMKKKQILIQGEDNQLVTIRRNKATKFFDNEKEIKATDIDLETPISIEANEDTDLKMLAVNVKVTGSK